jgi:serine/threonine protein kinase
MALTPLAWRFKDRLITEIEDMPEGTYGFIYKVVHLPTKKKYIGKKVLFFERNVKLGKRETEALREERKAAGIGGRVPAKKKVVKESDWKTYYGSQEEIKKLARTSKPEDWTREILDFVPTKKLLTYYEIKHIFKNDALEDSDFLNDNILGKFYQKDFIKVGS